MKRHRMFLALSASVSASCASRDPIELVAVTFNSGTSEGMPHDAAPDDGYGAAQALTSDQWYGDGLAWSRAIADVHAFFERLSPDLVGFQEIFHPGDCTLIPPEARTGWVCEHWKDGDPTVVQLVVGAGYQVACNLQKPDKCLAVKRAFGTFRGCQFDVCLDGLAGARVPECGSGSRVGRGVIELAGGGTLTVVNVHGSSGVASSDADCRSRQFGQVFEDLGTSDGPAANGERNLVLGDFNTDPIRFEHGDPSADALVRLAFGAARPFQFISEIGESATPTYGGIVNIDHQLSDSFTGSCWSAGITEGHPPVTSMVYFDHKPLVCNLSEIPRTD
ncbi:MAG: hypothetical protein HY791_11580 [Deltaproteobacteria bacterium]|nr:hypothetical protein [Deltaproteobacteria bacterium]